ALHHWAAVRDVFSPYFVKGVLSFPISSIFVYLPLILFFLACLKLLFYQKKVQPSRYLVIFSIVYAEMTYFYFVWGATMKHLLNIAPTLLMACTIYLWDDLERRENY